MPEDGRPGAPINPDLVEDPGTRQVGDERSILRLDLKQAADLRLLGENELTSAGEALYPL
jgi:hypothetical protein